MAGALTTRIMKDHTGAPILQRLWDESGTGAGPFQVVAMLVDSAGVAITPAKDTSVDGIEALLTTLNSSVNINGRSADASSAPVALSNEDVALLTAISGVEGTTAGAKVVTDASGTIQQYLRGLVTFFANVLGAGTAAAAYRTTLASDDPAVATLGATSGVKVVTDANGTVQQYLRGLVTFFANALGAGTAVAAYRTTLASDDPAVATLGATSGAKVITDANGTIQQYLRGLVSQWIAGTLTFASSGYSAAVTLTRTADTNAYTANDVIGAATGSTAALTFSNMGPSGKEIIITSVQLEVDVASLPAGAANYRLYLYNVTPPSALGDNAAFDLPSGDRASYLGYVDLGTPVDLGSTLYVETANINKQVKLSGTSLFAYLVTIGAYTPTSAAVKVITLHAVAP